MSTLDRKAHSEALIVSFIAEHSMPFTAAPSLIQLIPELAQDAKKTWYGKSKTIL